MKIIWLIRIIFPFITNGMRRQNLRLAKQRSRTGVVSVPLHLVREKCLQFTFRCMHERTIFIPITPEYFHGRNFSFEEVSHREIEWWTSMDYIRSLHRCYTSIAIPAGCMKSKHFCVICACLPDCLGLSVRPLDHG